jgi:crotonobetainyl-CoA:carnitine CoA-transferase CaiB-like acyl-CoA transferase
MSELLSNIRVLEFGQLLAAGSVGMYLADVGADVIKIESPFLGDYGREIGGVIRPHVSVGHVQRNKNKRSVALDLRNAEGREIFWRILDTADVFLDGTVAGSAEKLGIGYEQQRQHKPDIVYCSYSGFGSTGPYAAIPTHGVMMGALAAQEPHTPGDDGLMHPSSDVSVTRAGGEPTAAGALTAAFGISSALVQRLTTGKGCRLDIAGSDAVVKQAWVRVTMELNGHLVSRNLGAPKRAGEWKGARYHFYETRDGKVILFCAIEPKFWAHFIDAVARPDLAGIGAGGLVDYADEDQELVIELQSLFRTRDERDWVRLAADHDFPLGPAPRALQEMMDDPHVQARGMIFEADFPEVGPFKYISSAVKVDGQSNDEIRVQAPTLGRHTAEVLHGLGVKSHDLDRLEREKVILTGS